MQRSELTRQQERREARKRGAGNRRVLATAFKIDPVATKPLENSNTSDNITGVKVTPAGKRRRLDGYSTDARGSDLKPNPDISGSSTTHNDNDDLNNDKENSILPRSLENSPEDFELSNHKNMKKPGWTPGGVNMPQSVRRTNQIKDGLQFSHLGRQSGFTGDVSPVKRALLFPADTTVVESNNTGLSTGLGDEMSTASSLENTYNEESEPRSRSVQNSEPLASGSDTQGADSSHLNTDTPLEPNLSFNPENDNISEVELQHHDEDYNPDEVSVSLNASKASSVEDIAAIGTHQDNGSDATPSRGDTTATSPTENAGSKRTKSRVRRPARSEVQDEDAKSDEELVSLKLLKLPLRAGGTNRVNAMDVVSQVCLELSDQYASHLDTKWAQNALSQYCQLLSQRFSRIIDMIDVNSSVMQAMRRIQLRRNSLRERLLDLRSERIEASHRIEAVREEYHRKRNSRLNFTAIGSFADDIAALRALRSKSVSSKEPEGALKLPDGRPDGAYILPLINTQWGSYARLKTLGNLLSQLDHGLS